MEADVSDHPQVKLAIDQVAENLGRIDILVNNAGIEKRSPFLEITPRTGNDNWQSWKSDINSIGI